MKRILLVAVAVIVGVPLLVTAWFYIGGIETGDTSLPDDADLLWSPPEVADEDNAFIAIMAATNLINCTTLGTNSWDKVDMSFVSGYANINTNRDSTARRIRADPAAWEKADRLLADNEAFYAAFAKGLERKGFRNSEPPDKVLGYPFPPVSVYLRMARLWWFKIQREADRGEWELATKSAETLHRYGRMISDNAESCIDLLIGNGILSMAYSKMSDLATMGGLDDGSLTRLSRLLDDDAQCNPVSLANVFKGIYTSAAACLLNSPYEAVLAAFRWRADCLEIFGRWGSSKSMGIWTMMARWPGYSGFALHRRTTLNSLMAITRNAIACKVEDKDVCDMPNSLFEQNCLGRVVACSIAKDYDVCLSVVLCRRGFERCRLGVVIAVARWRLNHDGELPPTLDALVPQYLPAVPADPWSKDGKLLNYDAAAGVVWSVGESGDFDYSKLPVEKSRRLRGKIGKYVDRFAFRLDGKPLNLMDNAK